MLASCIEPEVDVYGSISGIVKNGQTGEFVSGVKVTLSPGGTSQITASDGAFSFENLDSGEYTMSFTKDGFEDESSKVSVKAGVVQNVQIAMIPIQPKISVSTSVLNFAEDGTSLSLDITNSGKGTLNWEITENIDWIECSPMSGSVSSASSSVVVTADRSRLDQGNYSGSFVITSNGGSETIVVSISVNGIALSVEPAELDFGTVTGSLELTLTNTGSGSLSYTVESSNTWLIPGKSSGTVSKTDYINVVVSREGMSAGKYNGSLTFGTSKGSIVVPVKMEIVKNEKPTVAVESSSDVTYNSARLHGTVMSVGSDRITRFGFCWSEKDNPTTADYYCNLGDCSNARSFDTIISGLEAETKYYFRAYAENSVGLSYSDKVLTFTTYGIPTVPGVSTQTVDNVTSSSARAKGNITSLGNVSKILSYGHVWSTSPTPVLETSASTNLGELTTTSSFTSKLENLSAYTTYYVRAYAINEKGVAYGDDVAFVTGKGNPVVETGSVTEIIHNAATCEGRIVTTGGHDIPEYGICWGKSAMPTYSGSHIAADYETGGVYHIRLEGLEEQMTYYSRAYVKTSEGTLFYGSDVKFATTKEIKLPMLEDVTVSEISFNSAELHSRITSDGGSTIDECGFCWGNYPKPDVSDNVLKCSPSSKELSKVLGSLEPGKKYYVRAFATNVMGTEYSHDCSFYTLEPSEPKVKTVEVVSTGHDTAVIKGSIEDLGDGLVTAYGFCYSATETNPTLDHTSCSYGKTDKKGTFEGEITGLKPKTKYYVRAYATNSLGTVYGNVLNLTTSAKPPLLPSGLLAYYTFDEQNCDDYLGEEDYCGVIQGTGNDIKFVEDTPTGEGYALKGSDEGKYYQLLVAPDYNQKTVTYSVWLKSKNTTLTYVYVQYHSTYYGRGIRFWNGYLCYSIYMSLDNWSYFEGFCFDSVLFDGNWHHFVFVWKPEDFSMYVDGRFMYSSSTTYNANDSRYYQGKVSYLGKFSGLMDNFRIYNRALTKEEIIQIRDAKE